MIAYNVIVGDTITQIVAMLGMEDSIFANRTFVIIFCATFIMLPLSSLKDMSTLSNTSAISVACDILIVLIVCIKCLLHTGTEITPHVQSTAAHPKGVVADPWDFAHSAFLEAFGAMCFAFVCHHSSFLVYMSLKNPTTKRWSIVSHSSIGVALFLCLTLSIVGYSKFQMDTQANILNNFPKKDATANFCRFLLALTMFFTYPMEFFVCRHCYLSTVHEGQEISNFLHYTVTVVIWAVCLVIGVSFTDLGFVLSLTGGFAATFLGFILPALCYLCIENMGTGKPYWGVFEWETLSDGTKMGALFLLVFGIIAMFCSTGMTFYDEFSPAAQAAKDAYYNNTGTNATRRWDGEI